MKALAIAFWASPALLGLALATCKVLRIFLP